MGAQPKPIHGEIRPDSQIDPEVAEKLDEFAAAIRPKSEVVTKHDRMIQALLPRHFKMIELALEGKSVVQIAKELGMNKCSVSSVLKSPMIQNELARQRAERESKMIESENIRITGAMNILNAQADEAARTLGALLKSPDERIQLSSAKEILDRVLDKKTGEQGGPKVMIQADQLQLLNLSIKESLGRLSVPAIASSTADSTADTITTQGEADATERSRGTEPAPGIQFPDAETTVGESEPRES